MVLAALVAALSLAPDPSTLPRQPPPRERIESISLKASGIAGSLETSPEFVHGARQVYRFGEGPCDRISAELLEQLLLAMRGRTYVRIDATAAEHRGAPVQCIGGATFYPP